MNVFTIKDLENLSGIKAHTIRIWEQRYDFLKPSRTGTNIRYYRNQEVKTVLNISLLTKYGYKISHINKMSEQELKNKVISLSDKNAQEERLVNQLIACMIDLDIESFEKLLDAVILDKGVDKTITRIVFPFMHRIGLLWAIDHINPAQEHLVSNVIRQKLMVGIEATMNHKRAGKTVLLFLPEGERHELGLLYVYYLLKFHGAGAIYLGADISLGDVEFVCRQKHPDFIYTHLTGVAGNFSLEKFLSQVNLLIPGIPLVLSGQLARTQMRKIPPHIHFRRSIPEVLEFIASL
jgi:MerR family transcriptional regulator, light-induced transcriptional regulator